MRGWRAGETGLLRMGKDAGGEWATCSPVFGFHGAIPEVGDLSPAGPCFSLDT